MQVQRAHIFLVTIGLLTSTLIVNAGVLDMKFGTFRKLSKAKRRAIYLSLSIENQYNFLAGCMQFHMQDRLKELDRLTLRQVIAIGREWREHLKEILDDE